MDASKLGTPKSLDEATMHAICFRPPKGMGVDAWVRGVFRDYLAQKFQAALWKCKTENEAKVVSELWSAITGEKKL